MSNLSFRKMILFCNVQYELKYNRIGGLEIILETCTNLRSDNDFNCSYIVDYVRMGREMNRIHFIIRLGLLVNAKGCNPYLN